MCSQVIDGGSDGTRPLELLERDITSLASQIHAATCRWLCLVAEYDAREGWAQWACRSCAHWVSWQCGIAPGAAREHVRVARRLRELPLVRAAFAAGELSYSKVRALTRVENVEREAELVELARCATASQLERLLRAYRGVVAAEHAAAGGRPARWLVVEHDDDGSVLVRGRFPAEEGALIVAALETAQDQLPDRDDRSAARIPPETPAGTGEPVPDARTPRGAREPARNLMDTGSKEAAGAGEPVADVPAEAPAGGDDPVSDESARMPAATDGPSLDVPAGTRTGGNVPAPDLPVGMPVGAGDPLLDVPAGTPRMSPSEARADALVAVADAFLAGARRSRTGGDRHQVLVHVDAATLTGADESGRCELEHGAPLAAETARRLACDASIVRVLERDGKPLSLARKTRTIPAAVRRALRTRDHGCRFPGCTARRFLDAHHIEHWARGGATDLDNLIQLCGTHHRLLHEGGFGVRYEPDGKLTFYRSDGRSIPHRPFGPQTPPARLQRTRRPDACVPLAHDRLDLGLAVDAMLTFASGEPPGV